MRTMRQDVDAARGQVADDLPKMPDPVLAEETN
jgi:hypothetical protein